MTKSADVWTRTIEYRNLRNITLPAEGPIECAPWCEDGDGHRDVRYREDQTCCGPTLRVPLSLHTDYAEVYPVRPADAGTEIRYAQGGGLETRFTPAEARQLVEALQLILGQIAVAR